LHYRSGKEKEVLAMENGGNAKVNAIFEARLGSTRKPTTAADGQTRERFIRDKYERRKYYDPSALENYVVSEEDDEEEEEAPAPSRRTKVTRHPSEAARLRAEKKSGTPRAVPTKAAPAPAPAAAQVDLLDFGAFDSPAPATDAFPTLAPSAAAAATFPAPPVPAPPVPAPVPAAESTPNLDLFANMTVIDTPAAPPVQQAQRARTTNDQIMAMFNTSLQPTAVAMTTPNGGMMMAMPPQQNPMMQQNRMMQGSGYGFGNNNNMAQQQPNAMFMQNQGNAMFMQQQGNSTLMMQQNNQGNVMLMQQGQKNNNIMLMQQGNTHMAPNAAMQMMQPNAMQMMQQTSNSDGFGFPQEAMGSGPPIAQNDGQFYNAYTGTQTSSGMQQLMQNGSYNADQGMSNAASPTKQDPFSQFGTNVFR
jgi:hypothetical protein